MVTLRQGILKRVVHISRMEKLQTWSTLLFALSF